MDNFIIIAVLAVILGVAIAYVVKQKKKGVKCIGCPDGEDCRKNAESGCSGNCSCCSSCGSHEN